MRNFIVILALLCAPVTLPAQHNALLRSIAFLTGAEDVESLDQQEIDRFFFYAAHPLRINSASLSRLVSSGLFSQYQAACLLDYRQRQGDVLSVAELALVDGFGEGTARALAPFLSFESDRLPGSPAVSARPAPRARRPRAASAALAEAAAAVSAAAAGADLAVAPVGAAAAA